MALLKQYVQKNIEDKFVQLKTIPELFCKAGFKDTPVYNDIQAIIKENDITVETILTTRKTDLIEMFNLKQEDDKNKLIRMRTVLRKADIEKMKKLDISQIETFTWEHVCQVFEENVGMSDIEQSDIWYNFFEDNGINGDVLLKMKVKTKQESFAKNRDQERYCCSCMP